MEPSALYLKIGTPELRDLVQDVTKTLSYVVRPFGIDFTPATAEEADAIAAPGARMLAKYPKVQSVIRKIADPVVLIGAVLALFAVRRWATHRSARGPLVGLRPPAPPSSNAPVKTVDSGRGATAAPAPTILHPVEAQLRDSILDSIANAGTGQ